MRSLAVLVLVLVGCAAPEALEERELSSSHLEASEPSPLAVGTSLKIRLSVDIRADLLPKAKLSSNGQAITYGKPALLYIQEGRVSATATGLRCSVHGFRPPPSMDRKYFPPILPNPLVMTVVRAAEGTISLETTPDDEDTTWHLDCSKGVTLEQLRSALGEDSTVTPE